MSLGNYTGAVVREGIPMRSKSPSRVMPAQRHPAASRGGDPIFAGIHVFLASFEPKKTWMAGTSLDKHGHDSGIMMHCLHFNITMRFKKRQTANIVIKTKR